MNNKVFCVGISEDMATVTQIFHSDKVNKMQVTQEAASILENI